MILRIFVWSINGSQKKGKRELKIHFLETEHCGLIFGPPRAVSPPGSGSVEDNHGSCVLGPMVQRQRR